MRRPSDPQEPKFYCVRHRLWVSSDCTALTHDVPSRLERVAGLAESLTKLLVAATTAASLLLHFI